MWRNSFCSQQEFCTIECTQNQSNQNIESARSSEIAKSLSTLVELEKLAEPALGKVVPYGDLHGVGHHQKQHHLIQKCQGKYKNCLEFGLFCKIHDLLEEIFNSVIEYEEKTIFLVGLNRSKRFVYV